MSLATTEEIDRRNGDGGSKKCTKRSDESSELRRHGELIFDHEGDDGTDRRAAGDAENVRVGKRVAQQRLKARARDRERSADDDGKKNARKSNVHDDHAVIGGDAAALVEQHADQVAAKAVKRNLNGAQFQSDDDDDEQNESENAAA